MNKQTYHLTTPVARQNAVKAVSAAPEGMICEIGPKTRTYIQNAKQHAMFSDISRQVEFFGKKRDLESVKRLLVDAFARAKAKMGEPLRGHGYTLPSLDGEGVVQLGIQTRHLGVELTAELIEFLYAWGSEQNVVWSERFDIPGWVR